MDKWELTPEEIVLKEVRIPTGNDIGGYPVVQVSKEIDIDATLEAQLAKAQAHYTSLMEQEYERGRQDGKIETQMSREELIDKLEQARKDERKRIIAHVESLMDFATKEEAEDCGLLEGTPLVKCMDCGTVVIFSRQQYQAMKEE